MTLTKTELWYAAAMWVFTGAAFAGAWGAVAGAVIGAVAVLKAG